MNEPNEPRNPAENKSIEKLTANPLEYRGERVVTLGMVDEVHGRPQGTARRAFNANRERFTEGRNYFKARSDEIRSTPGVKVSGRDDNILLTEEGYFGLVKTFTDDLSWDVQWKLVRGYFRGQAGFALSVADESRLLAKAKLQTMELLEARNPTLPEEASRPIGSGRKKQFSARIFVYARFIANGDETIVGSIQSQLWSEFFAYCQWHGPAALMPLHKLPLALRWIEAMERRLNASDRTSMTQTEAPL